MGVVDGAVNMSEIAAQLNISTATVSRALRGIKGVHPKTRERVMKVADEMGYLRKETFEFASRTVLVLAQATETAAVQEYLSGISRAAVDCNCSVLTHHLPLDRCGEMLDPGRQPPALREGRLDAILLVCKWPDDIVRELSRKVPIVSLIHKYPGVVLDRVGIDNESGMNCIVEHLFELGHRQLGFFGVHPSITWARSRYGAYAESLMSHGLRFAEEWVVGISEKDALAEGIIDASAYVPKIKALISLGVTAVVCAGDHLCYALMGALSKEGIRVPEDISLTGFHSKSQLLGLPALTSVEVSSEELGIAALLRMVRRLEFPDEAGRTILLPCELVVGASTSIA